MESARYDHQMEVLGDTVFAFGGQQYNNSSELNTVEIFDASTESWRLYSERLFSNVTSGMAITSLPLSSVACNQGCKCGIQGKVRIIGGNKAKVKNLIWITHCIILDLQAFSHPWLGLLLIGGETDIRYSRCAAILVRLVIFSLSNLVCLSFQ